MTRWVISVALAAPADVGFYPNSDHNSRHAYMVVHSLQRRRATMHENEIPAAAAPKRIPWNRGKLIGPRPPLRQKHVWAIRTRLQLERQLRGLALFNLAIDSKLRG